MLRYQRADCEGAEALLPDLAVGEAQEVRSIVARCPSWHQILLDHVTVYADGLAHFRRIECRLLAVGRKDVDTRAPDQRRKGEDHAAATAAAREIESIGVVAELADPCRVCLDLFP